jgi:release factor glutamine methyltransferase
VKRENVKTVLEIATQRLAAAGCDTPRLDAEVLLAHSLGNKDRTWLYVHPLDSLDAQQINRFEALLQRREQREPVAYLVGHKEFFGLEFEVNLHVLIPRPETELLVETALRMANERTSESASQQMANGESLIPNPQPPIPNTQYPEPKAPYGKGTLSPISIADVGTGSGCIAIALANNLPNATFFAIDASPEALQLAQRNANRHGVADRIIFLEGNLLQPLTSPVDLIVTNPPYVSHPELVAASVSPEVSQYEPRLALDGGQDGLEVIRQLLTQARAKLKPGGSLLVEIGSTQGQAVVQLAETYFPGANIQVKKDLAGWDRLLVTEL